MSQLEICTTDAAASAQTAAWPLHPCVVEAVRVTELALLRVGRTLRDEPGLREAYASPAAWFHTWCDLTVRIDGFQCLDVLQLLTEAHQDK